MNVPDADAPPRHINRARLRRLLADRFDAGELRTLCFDLQIDYDDLPGAGKANKARDLVAYMERHARLPQLIALGRKLRPDVPWDQVFDRAPDTSLGRLRADLDISRRRRLYTGLAGLALILFSLLVWKILSSSDQGAQALPQTAAHGVTLSFTRFYLEGYNVRDILADGDVWVAADQVGIRRFDGNVWHDYGTLAGRVTEPQVLARDPVGRIWVGDEVKGLTVLSTDGQVLITSNLPESEVTAVALTADGEAWIGVGHAVHRLDTQGGWTIITPSVQSSYFIQEITLDAQGDVWVALLGAGIGRLDPDTLDWDIITVESYATITQCLPSDYVNTLYIDEQGRKWIGTCEGLSILVEEGGADQWYNFTMDDGLPSSDVRAIVADGAGHFYIGTAKGLAVLDGTPRMIPFSTQGKDTLADANITALAFEPASETLWVGTVKKGLSIWKIDPR